MMSRRRWIAVGAVLLVLVGVLVTRHVSSPQTKVAAVFDRSTGLYVGDDVRILGVKVGKVDTITPQGTTVRVTFHYRSSHKVPADAKAAIIAPSLVSGRYLQLAPVYTGGTVLASGSTIPRERTAAPVEWSQLETQLTDLTTALGPDGPGKGALNTLITSGALALGSNGSALGKTISSLAASTQTLSDGKGDLFTTVRNLDEFVNALDDSSAQVTSFSNELASISQLLNDNKGQLALLLRQADAALTSVTGFIQANKARLGTSVAGLTDLAHLLSKDQVQLANVLHLVPTTLANLYNVYDPKSGAFAGRLAVAQTNGIAGAVCQLIFSLGGTLQDCKKTLGPVLDELNTQNLPIGLRAPNLSIPTQAQLTQILTGGGS
jgi:phospholipid/cholesterol/gamma-HCH transport system substrate-binding protein